MRRQNHNLCARRDPAQRNLRQLRRRYKPKDRDRHTPLAPLPLRSRERGRGVTPNFFSPNTTNPEDCYEQDHE